MFVDSLDKIFNSYIRAVCTSPVKYKKEVFTPRPLRVSPGLLRGFICPEGCAGCCPRFSLDYLPCEKRPDSQYIRERYVEVNGKKFLIFSDLQDDHDDHFCRHVDKKTGRCKIHGLQPFSCDFELIRFSISRTPGRPNYINQRLFGRGWAFKRVDGGRGALCKITPPTEESVSEVIRKLKRLEQWANYFEIETCIPSIITQVEDMFNQLRR